MKRSSLQLTLILSALLILSGCLVTRQEVREKTGSGPTPEQRERAESRARYSEVDEQLRELVGKVETLEKGLNNLTVERGSSNEQWDAEKKSLAERNKIYEETLSRIESQLLLLSQKVEVLSANTNTNSNSAKTSAATSKDGAGKKNSYQLAEDEFAKKNWKQAIVAFEKYRELNPKGRYYSDATFKIGMSFQELGMGSEAKVFYNEVIDKSPKSDLAKKATAQLKKIK
jgi:TolA-binding protein